MKPPSQFNDRALRKQTWEIEHDRFVSEVKASLDQIFNPRFQLPFGVACCQRMLPSYAAFQRNARWGNFRLLFDLSDVLWRECQASRLKSEDIRSIIREIDSAYADSEATHKGEGIREVETAQDVCSVFYQALQFILTKDISLLQLAARITLEHFENKAYFSAQPDAIQRHYSGEQHMEEENRRKVAAWEHPAVQDERARQKSDLASLVLLSQKDDGRGLSDFIAARSCIRTDLFGVSFDEADIEARFPTERVDPERTTVSAFYRPEPPRTRN